MKRARVSDLSKVIYLSPEDIRFSQDTIAANFTNGNPIGKTLDALVRMEVFVTEIPAISVAVEDGVYFTRNNRRLWVYKQLAAMNRCSFIPCNRAYTVPREQFTTAIGGHEIIIRGDHHSETLAEFTTTKRREMLQRIHSQQVADDKPRGTFRPRFEYMSNQKRRKVKGKRRLAPNRIEENDTGKVTAADKNVMPTSRDTAQDHEIEPAFKARKLEKGVASKDNQSELKKVSTLKCVPDCKKETVCTTVVKIDTEVIADNVKGDKIDSNGDKENKYDFQKHAGKNPDINFGPGRDVNVGEASKDWVVVDQTGDFLRNDSCVVDVKLTDKPADTNLWKFTAVSKPSNIPERSGAKKANKKNRKRAGKTRNPTNRQVNQPYASSHGLDRGASRIGNQGVSQLPYNQPFHSVPNHFVQPQRNHFLPSAYVGNIDPQYNHDICPQGRFSHADYRSGYGQSGQPGPVQRGQISPAELYRQQIEYMRGSSHDHMLHYSRY